MFQILPMAFVPWSRPPAKHNKIDIRRPSKTAYDDLKMAQEASQTAQQSCVPPINRPKLTNSLRFLMISAFPTFGAFDSQKRSKRPSSWPKDSPRGPNVAPRRPQKLQMPPTLFEMFPIRANMALRQPKMVSIRFKKARRRPKMDPKATRMVPRCWNL